MSELEQRLTRLGGEVGWPETPDLAPAVRSRLSGPVGHRGRPPLLRRSFALAVAALLLLAGGVFAAVPGARDAVLDLFGLQGATVERRPSIPSAPELRLLELGQRTTLERARRELGFTPLLPRAAGRPAAVFVNDRVTGGELSLTYGPGPGMPATGRAGVGLLVSEFRGDLAPEYMGKITGQTTRIEPLRVDGDRALWIQGAPHLFFYRPPDADFAEIELRLARNVLLRERGRLLIRLEGSFNRDRALELARSLAP